MSQKYQIFHFHTSFCSLSPQFMRSADTASGNHSSLYVCQSKFGKDYLSTINRGWASGQGQYSVTPVANLSSFVGKLHTGFFFFFKKGLFLLLYEEEEESVRIPVLQYIFQQSAFQGSNKGFWSELNSNVTAEMLQIIKQRGSKSRADEKKLHTTSPLKYLTGRQCHTTVFPYICKSRSGWDIQRRTHKRCKCKNFSKMFF